MTFYDFMRLMRHYIKMIIVVPVICVVLTILVLLVAPPTYVAQATLLTNGDIALIGGYAQNEAATFSQNDITVTSETDVAYRTITVEAEGKDYGGCIAAVNAAVLAAAADYRQVDTTSAVTTNEATTAESLTPSIPKTALVAFFVGLFLAVFIVVLIDMVKAPIKSRSDVESTAELPVIGTIPDLDRGERLLANIRFSSDDPITTIAVVPTGLTGATLTCAELTSAFEHSGVPVSRIPGNPHAEGFNHVPMPGIVTIVECAPLSEGMGAVYIAKEADLTVLCVNEWSDSKKTLANVVEELTFAQANIAGAVLLTGKMRLFDEVR